MLRIDNSHQLFVGGCVSAWFVIQTAAAEVEQLTLPAQVVFEATRHYGFIYDSLKSIKAIKRIVMAYPGHVRLVFRGKQRNDRMPGNSPNYFVLTKPQWRIFPRRIPQLGRTDWVILPNKGWRQFANYFAKATGK